MNHMAVGHNKAVRREKKTRAAAGPVKLPLGKAAALAFLKHVDIEATEGDTFFRRR